MTAADRIAALREDLTHFSKAVSHPVPGKTLTALLDIAEAAIALVPASPAGCRACEGIFEHDDDCKVGALRQAIGLLGGKE